MPPAPTKYIFLIISLSHWEPGQWKVRLPAGPEFLLFGGIQDSDDFIDYLFISIGEGHLPDR